VATTPHVLWPPFGQMVPVNVTVSATDLGGTPACTITRVASDEPVRRVFFGRPQPDWQITGPLSLRLRAERDGFGDGRVYTITVTCTDPSGNRSNATGTVLVPHDMRHWPGGRPHHDVDGCERNTRPPGRR
jgi:hypothetical protein